jgi:hypothetical protein
MVRINPPLITSAFSNAQAAEPNSQPASTLSTPGNKKKSYNTDQAAAQITRMGFRWKDLNNDGVTRISFQFFTASKAPFNTPKGANKFTAAQKDDAIRAMQYWSDVANITFTQNAPYAEGKMLLGNDSQLSVAGQGSYPGIYSDGTQVWIASDGKERPPSQDHFGQWLMNHEIGHTLGLLHPGNYNGAGASYATHAKYAEDTRAYSIMSYWWEGNLGHDFAKHQRTYYPSTPMMDDITAVQKLYGANYKTRNTDTTYGFNANAGREAFSLRSSNDAPVFCIWDGGGNDTLDFSGFHQNQRINLNAQHFSDVGGMQGNVSIAKGVTIENAIGGSGDDRLTGNAANNRLKGGAGADRLTGGAGADTFVYDKASDSTLSHSDLLADFSSGQDKIDVSGALREARVDSLRFVARFSGRAGEAVLGYNPSTRESSLSIDLNGNGNADLFIRSSGAIKASDVIVNGSTVHRTVPQAPPATSTLPTLPGPTGKTNAPQRAPFSLQNWSSESLKNSPMYTSAKAVGSIREVTVVRDSWGYDRVHYNTLGTGSLIDTGASVLTNKHVHDALAKGSKLELWLGYTEDESGRMRVERKVPLDSHAISSDAHLDYAELRVDLPQAQISTLAKQFPPLKLADNPQAKAGQKIFMPNHGQQGLGISFLNAEGKPTTLLGRSTDSGAQSAFYHDAYKIPGTSGSPLISADTGEIIALHYGSIIGQVGNSHASRGAATRAELIQQHRKEPQKQA